MYMLGRLPVDASISWSVVVPHFLDLSFQVWNSRKFCDQFLGQVTLDADPSDCRDLKSLYLRKKGGPTAKVKQGHISFKVISSDDLTEL